MTESQNRGIGRGRVRGRGRVLGVQSEDVRRVERADVSARSQMPIRESSPSSASVGNERSDRPNVRAVSHQGSSISAASASIFERVPRRVRNVYHAPPQEVQRDVPVPPVAPVVHFDTIDLARTMATMLAECKRYRRPGDIIEHAKKCGAYDFHGTLDPGQADKWIKTVDKAFNTLQLSDVEKVGNVYRLLFEKADNWLTRVKTLYGEALTWQLFKEEFGREYLTETFQKQRKAAFMNLTQGSMSVRDYADKFEDLYLYAKEMYPTEEVKIDKFRDGLHVSLRGKLNLYAGTTFRGWVE